MGFSIIFFEVLNSGFCRILVLLRYMCFTIYDRHCGRTACCTNSVTTGNAETPAYQLWWKKKSWKRSRREDQFHRRMFFLTGRCLVTCQLTRHHRIMTPFTVSGTVTIICNLFLYTVGPWLSGHQLSGYLYYLATILKWILSIFHSFPLTMLLKTKTKFVNFNFISDYIHFI